MNCTREEFDIFVSSMIDVFDEDGKQLDNDQNAYNLLDTIVDLYWPDIPLGWTNEEFIDSWNRQIANKKNNRSA